VRGPWIASSYHDDPRSGEAFHGFLAILPKTSVGKLAKRALREQLAEHRWPAG
jgi:acyl-CoA synthetase (AMP-forming)/AMP-acid ligase II